MVRTSGSKRKKPSTGLHISRPYVPRARTIRVHCNDNRTGSSTTHSVVSAASSETLRMLPPDSESDNSFSEYAANQTDIQHNDPAEANPESKQRKRTAGKAMEEWLAYRDTYLQEMLRHDGREGLAVTDCAECGDPGNFSCSDCAYSVHYCQTCLVNRHRLMPFHRIRVSNPIL